MNKFMEDAVMGRVVDYIEANYMEKISLEDLEFVAGVSRFALSRVFRKHLGVPPIAWLWAYRTEIAADLLFREPLWSCSEIGYQCGFESPAHFARKFCSHYGWPPGRFRAIKVDGVQDLLNSAC